MSVASAPALRVFRRPRLWLMVWLAMIAAVIAGSLAPPAALPVPLFPGVDKLQHLLGYFALSAFAVALFARQRGRTLAAVGLVLLGLAIEVAQARLTAARQADLIDAACNTLGVLLALPLAATPLARALQWLDARLP